MRRSKRERADFHSIPSGAPMQHSQASRSHSNVRVAAGPWEAFHPWCRNWFSPSWLHPLPPHPHVSAAMMLYWFPLTFGENLLSVTCFVTVNPQSICGIQCSHRSEENSNYSPWAKSRLNFKDTWLSQLLGFSFLKRQIMFWQREAIIPPSIKSNMVVYSYNNTH